MGQRLNIIIIAEGAIDSDGKSITPDCVKNVSAQYDVVVAWSIIIVLYSTMDFEVAFNCCYCELWIGYFIK